MVLGAGRVDGACRSLNPGAARVRSASAWADDAPFVQRSSRERPVVCWGGLIWILDAGIALHIRVPGRLFHTPGHL